MLLANQQPAEGQIFGWGKTLGMPYICREKWEGWLNEKAREAVRLLGLNGVGGDVVG